jgi:hypothetical protein
MRLSIAGIQNCAGSVGAQISGNRYFQCIGLMEFLESVLWSQKAVKLLA